MRAFSDRFIALVCALAVLAVLITAARADAYEDGLRRFTADSFDETIEGINAVATSGNARAAQVIGALQEGRLLFSAAEKRVFIREMPDQLIDAATGRPVAGDLPSDLAPVRLNNRLRRIVEAALGSLTLMAPDLGKRLEAAQAVLKSKDANALPALEQAIAGESDPRVKQALSEAKAAVVLYLDSAPDTDKIDAIAVIRQRGDQEALALLGGLPANASPAVKKAAADAIASIENSLALWTALQNAWYGLSLETLLATWGLSLILQQGVRTVFGPTNKDVGNPSWMSGSFDLGLMTITYNRLWIIVFTLLIFMGLLALLRFTRFGLEMRAVTQNRAMAASMGIRTSRIDALTFGLGSGIAGLAGVALSQIDNVSPNLGQGYIIDSFMVVVFGGVGNLWGTLVGTFTLGIANKFLEPYAGAVLGKIAILVLLILFIHKRPRGLFALKGRAVEA